MTATVRSNDAEQIVPPVTATHVVDLTSKVRLRTQNPEAWRCTVCAVEFGEYVAASCSD